MNLLKKIFQQIEWKTNIETVSRDGYEWECFTYWTWTWMLCGIGYECSYYDGEHKFWNFCIGSLYRCESSTYHERRKI
jgi:hypothetical protein